MASAAVRSPGAIRAQEDRTRDFTVDDVESLLPGCSPTEAVIEQFFRGQFEACLEAAGVEANLQSCLVFGPDTWADLRRLLLDGGEPGAGQQGFPALEGFCSEHDIASKQYLLLPLLTPGHGSLLIMCNPVKGQGGRRRNDPDQPTFFDVRRAAFGPRLKQEPLILHLDSAHKTDYQHQPDFSSLVSFLQPYLAKGKPALADWTSVPPCLTAHVPVQKAVGHGSTYMCTNALYFVACLPSNVDAEEVQRLKTYHVHLTDRFEYPGFLTRFWYPRNVPEALRKTLLRGITDRLLVDKYTSTRISRLLTKAEEIKSKLDASSSREFEMPAERWAQQRENLKALQLAASRLYWEGQGGWSFDDREFAGTVTCRRGEWYIRLKHHPLDRGLLFRDVVGDGVHGKPQEFDFCFGVPLKAGDKPPDFVVHVASNLLSTEAVANAGAAGKEEVQLTMYFTPEAHGWLLEKGCLRSLLSVLATRPAPPEVLCFKLRPDSASESDAVHVDFERHSAVPRAPQPAASGAGEASAGWAAGSAGTSAGTSDQAGAPCRAAGKADTGSVAGDAGPTRAAGLFSGVLGALRGVMSSAAGIAGAAGSSAAASAAGRAPCTAQPGAASMLAVQPRAQGQPSQPSSLAATAGLLACAAATEAAQAADTPKAATPAGAAGSADLLAATSLTGLALPAAAAAGQPAAAAAVPAAKGAKRSQPSTGGRSGKRPKAGSESDDKQLPRARLTVGGRTYFAGSFPTDVAAAHAKDLLTIWVHCSQQGWPAGWMQACDTIPLQYPVAVYMATHGQVLAGLSSCANEKELRALLRKHLTGAPSMQPSPADEALLLAVKQQWEAATAGEQQPAGRTAAGSSFTAKQQGVAAAGEQALDGSAAGQLVGQQRLQLAGLQLAGLPQAEPEAMQEDAAEQAGLWPSAQQQATGVSVAQRAAQLLPQPLPALAAGGQQQPQPEAAVAAAGDEQPLQLAALGVPLPAGSVSGRGGIVNWSAAVGRRAAAMLESTFDVPGSDEQRYAAQLRAVTAVLTDLNVHLDTRVAFSSRFALLTVEERTSRVIELSMIADERSPAELLAWLTRHSRGLPDHV